MDLQVREDSEVFQGTCSGGCTTGSTAVTVAVSSAPGTQGEGRYLIDKNPAKMISAGSLTSGSSEVNGYPGPSATFSGTNFPVSVFLSTAQLIPSQANNVAPDGDGADCDERGDCGVCDEYSCMFRSNIVRLRRYQLRRRQTRSHVPMKVALGPG